MSWPRLKRFLEGFKGKVVVDVGYGGNKPGTVGNRPIKPNEFHIGFETDKLASKRNENRQQVLLLTNSQTGDFLKHKLGEKWADEIHMYDVLNSGTEEPERLFAKAVESLKDGGKFNVGAFNEPNSFPLSRIYDLAEKHGLKVNLLATYPGRHPSSAVETGRWREQYAASDLAVITKHAGPWQVDAKNSPEQGYYLARLTKKK